MRVIRNAGLSMNHSFRVLLTVAAIAVPQLGTGLSAAENDRIAVAQPKTLPGDSIPCQRVPIGVPDDYKPCIARLPDGELLLTAFHQHKKDGKKVLEQTLLFRSRDGGLTWSKPEELPLLGREPYLTVLKDGTVFITGHLLADDVRAPH